MLYISMDTCPAMTWSYAHWVVFFCIEMLFFIDMVLWFFTVQQGTKKPYSLKKTAKRYLKGMFIIDFVATVVSSIMLFGGHAWFVWGIKLKSVRIFRRNYIRLSYISVVKYCAVNNPERGKVVKYILQTTIEIIFWLHVFTCIWIKLGSIDCFDDQWVTKPDTERSWMFLEGSDFNGDNDQRMIYEQITDPESDKDMISLYLYALYWVLTVVTTVGYGHATYQTNLELLYCCILEVIAFLTQAMLITVLTRTFNFEKISFDYMIQERMWQSKEWLVFKVQRPLRPDMLKEGLTDKIFESFYESFSCDINMIVEEFNFYQMLPPKMQSELVDYLFYDILDRFKHVFNFCENGFRNELMI